ncbi:MAG: hypothetical protein KHX03_04125 [Clostridium sp.]|nr:hypothetical protein [Clostridium sp.]
MRKFFDILILTFIFILFVNNEEAKAYINPGSGSYIFQAIAGGILSILYFFKKIFLSILNIFKPGKNSVEKSSSDE